MVSKTDKLFEDEETKIWHIITSSIYIFIFLSSALKTLLILSI
jgi:hypothetical protein